MPVRAVESSHAWYPILRATCSEAALPQDVRDRLAHLQGRQRGAAAQRHVGDDQAIRVAPPSVEQTPARGRRKGGPARRACGLNRVAGGARHGEPNAPRPYRHLPRRVPDRERGGHAVGARVDAGERPAQAVESPHAAEPVGHIAHADAHVDRALDEPRLRIHSPHRAVVGGGDPQRARAHGDRGERARGYADAMRAGPAGFAVEPRQRRVEPERPYALIPDRHRGGCTPPARGRARRSARRCARRSRRD